MRAVRLLATTLILSACSSARAHGKPTVSLPLEGALAEASALYMDLHQNPELSGREERTAKRLADRLRQLGYEVSEGVGGTGVVAIVRHGAGRTLMVRTELDALPIREQTGLPYASQVQTRDASGQDVPVMHACGHDLHMAAWLATASIIAAQPRQFPGTIVFVAQPAEETLSGAQRMLDDGLFVRFPRPDAALAIHTHDALPAGTPGFALGDFGATSDSLDVTITGRSGHGAYPEAVIDPIVIAARTVDALQTVVSRERDPRDPAVLTVGAIHGGTKHNVVPESVALKLMLRTYTDATRTRSLAAIERIVAAEALVGGATVAPSVTVVEHTERVSSDPALTRKVLAALAKTTLPSAVELEREMGAEDFSAYEHAGVPGVFLHVGVVPADAYAAWQRGGPRPAPSHSGQFAPDLAATLRAAVLIETTAARTLLTLDKAH